MPDNETSTAQNTQTTEVKQPVSFGTVQKLNIVIPKDIPDEITDNIIKDSNGADATPKADNAGGTGTPLAAPTLPTPEQLKEYFKSLDIEYDGDEKIKQKLTPTTTAEPTLEQKEAQIKAAEKRRLDLFISGNGTAEQYVAIKNIAEMDLAELSMSTLRKELKEAKFSDEQIDQIVKERYYQITDEDLEQLEEESDKEFAKRKKEYGANKLANRSSYIQKQAQDALVQLNKVIESEDLQQKDELLLSSNIDEQFKTIQRKSTYEIGEINGKPITPIESEVPESDLAEIQLMLKDPAKRNNFLLTTDGNLNITNIANVLTENAKLKAALKVSYHEGSTRTNAFWESTFGVKSAQEIGVGGITTKPNQTNGKPAGFGKTQRVQPQRQ